MKNQNNILAIYGSPRKDGNSSLLVKNFLLGAEDAEKVNISHVYLDEEVINGCKACMACRKNETKTCIQKDGMQKVYDSLQNADVIVCGTPLYWWNISSQLKAMIDRMYPYIGTGKLKGKKLFVFVTGITEISNSGYELVEKMLSEVSAYIDMELTCYCVSADDERHIRNNEEAKKKVYEMGKAVYVEGGK